MYSVAVVAGTFQSCCTWGPTWRTRGAVASRHLSSRRPATPAAPPLLSCPPIRARPLPLDCNQETKLPPTVSEFPSPSKNPEPRVQWAQIRQNHTPLALVRPPSQFFSLARGAAALLEGATSAWRFLHPSPR
ncbi:hypothetical protein PVAP13_5NG378681 [Panicum virgatum]|uniref:Uncharacterized protein n=1 Tax=Panicum virgatum TaxID=38727 RepID=A0A8T0RZ92_PANVG|nr:hypothetical protein PVAP13_5NG378681 [Panicum virgatum]